MEAMPSAPCTQNGCQTGLGGGRSRSWRPDEARETQRAGLQDGLRSPDEAEDPAVTASPLHEHVSCTRPGQASGTVRPGSRSLR